MAIEKLNCDLTKPTCALASMRAKLNEIIPQVNEGGGGGSNVKITHISLTPSATWNVAQVGNDFMYKFAGLFDCEAIKPGTFVQLHLSTAFPCMADTKIYGGPFLRFNREGSNATYEEQNYPFAQFAPASPLMFGAANMTLPVMQLEPDTTNYNMGFNVAFSTTAENDFVTYLGLVEGEPVNEMFCVNVTIYEGCETE